MYGLKTYPEAIEWLSSLKDEDEKDAIREKIASVKSVFGSYDDPVILSFAGRNDDPWAGDYLKRTKLSEHVTLIELPDGEEEL
jgi:hypothetical protein